MKHTKPIKLLACCALLALASLEAVAQVGTEGTSPTAGRTVATNTARDYDRPNYSWIGLLGLAGMAGLLRRRQDDRLPTEAQVRHA